MADANGINGSLDALMRAVRGGGAPGGLTGLSSLLVVLVAVSAVAVPGFASGGTLQSILFQMPELGLLSLAMVIPLISGGLNLAIIATANQAALLMAWIMKSMLLPGAPGSEVAAVILAAMLAGLLLCALCAGAILAAGVAFVLAIR